MKEWPTVEAHIHKEKQLSAENNSGQLLFT